MPIGLRPAHRRSPLSSLLLASLLLVVAASLSACGSSRSAATDEAASTWRSADDEFAAEPLAPEEALSLEADIYEAMARLSRAQATARYDDAEAALEEAMQGMRRLRQAPGSLDDPEVRELYRSVLTAYEAYYGVTDTLTTEHGDIFTVHDELFETMNALREPLLEDVLTPPASAPVALTIPLTQNQLVEQSRAFLLRNPDRHLNNWRRRSATYFPMMEQILREEQMPDELKYLSMIESGLNPRARSRVGAGGLWQFMPATGREYGLNRDHWIDERSDPEKATRAAARYLRALHRQFDDWHLALAAYNCGPGRVARVKRRVEAEIGRTATFWDLYQQLPRETRNYVPMFIATTQILTNPAAYDLEPVTPGPRYAYEWVQVEGMTDLRVVAELAGTTVETVRALNPEVRQWTTPPTQSGYAVRVPQGLGARFAQAYAALPADERRGQTGYTVRRGDTLGKIARRYNTTVSALREANGIRGSLIQEGQTLYVPVRLETYAAANTGATQVSYEADRSGPPVRLASAVEERRAPAPAPAATSYRVQRGDNLTTIARRHGVSVRDLRAWNNLSSDRIQAGQRLALVPGASAPVRAPERAATTYTVRRGDNLTTIAQRHGVSVRDLRAWNGLATDRLQPGQRLAINGGASPARSAAQTTTHTVQRGQNLTTIARRYGVSVRDLRAWNGLSSDRLQPGQRLTVQGQGAASASGASGWVSYTVRRGDTLSSIASRHDTNVASVRKWNDLRTDRLQVGQRLALYIR
ncbi:MAG: LysM peptidoglycan-binding domain-containing protein [Bacteroidota bacterium]